MVDMVIRFEHVSELNAPPLVLPRAVLAVRSRSYLQLWGRYVLVGAHLVGKIPWAKGGATPLQSINTIQRT